jgi:plasmid stabilization system protein ParE
MAYKIIVSPRAQSEIEDAVDYYSIESIAAPKQFIAFLEYAYKSLEISPFFKIRYKNIRALKIKKFPYSLYFVVNEKTGSVRILSCFHHKMNPKKRPKN